jgi:hypothetical protein
VSRIEKQFWVVGGLYLDTRFERFDDGCSEERYGPFDSYDAAEREWQSRSGRQADNCRVFYRIVDANAAPLG